ncbi:hypothetical protein U5907_00880 [Bacteroidales bacterium MB20-C3-3]|jgi:hypothetical protein|nr:hypothetical protein U5907_00880 [Bacteroidales bacterium MB20-C3-3]
MERVRKGVFKYLVLISFVAYYSGATMFYHTHKSDDFVIVHSHFYFGGEAAAPNHCHSSSSIALISLISASLHFLATSLILYAFISKLLSVLQYLNDCSFIDHTILKSSSRAPPSISFSFYSAY